MNIKRAKEEIKHAIMAYLDKDAYGEYRIPSIRQRPILLMGPPGIGKTQIMEQIAGEMDLALCAYTITHHTRQSAVGLPFIREKVYNGEKRSVTEYTMSEIISSVYDRIESSGKAEGILFIDEINCVSETLAPTMLQFLQGKSFGNQKVPKGWIIVAAGNPPEYNRSVRDFDVVTLDRVKVVNVDADYAVWKEYAYSAGLHGAILSYLDIHKEYFYRMDTTVDGKQFVTARGWEDLSEMLYASERLGLPVDQELIIQYLQHPKIAKDFANYLELYYKYRSDYQIDEILSGTIRPGTLNKLKFAPFDEHLEVIGLLLARLNENFTKVQETDHYIGRLFEILKKLLQKLEPAENSLQEAEVRIAEDAADPVALLSAALEEEKNTWNARLAAGQNEKMLREEYRPIIATLEEYVQQMRQLRSRAEDTFSAEDLAAAAARALRSSFAAETENLEVLEQNAADQLEAAFDFMEAAFGESQEMVYFITELSSASGSVAWLREHDCDRYYMYNKSLLFENQESAVRGQLDEIRSRQVHEGLSPQEFKS